MKKYVLNGWCPHGATPYEAKDGFFFRIIPLKSSLNLKQAKLICSISQKYGNGIIDITNRGNLQIRGLKNKNLKTVVNELHKNHLIHKNIEKLLINPFWTENDGNVEIYNLIKNNLFNLPKLPEKFTITIDLEEKSGLSKKRSDIFIKTGTKNEIIICLPEKNRVKSTKKENLIENLFKLIELYINQSLFKREIIINKSKKYTLENGWLDKKSQNKNTQISKLANNIGIHYNSNFGQLDAYEFSYLLTKSNPKNVRFTPFKTFILEKAFETKTSKFEKYKDNHVNNLFFCSGIKKCTFSTIDTKKIAKNITNKNSKIIHVSGCAKGCAYPEKADITLVGNNGDVDIVIDGYARDNPQISIPVNNLKNYKYLFS